MYKGSVHQGLAVYRSLMQKDMKVLPFLGVLNYIINTFLGVLKYKSSAFQARIDLAEKGNFQ